MEWTDNELNIKFLLAKPIEINGVGILKPLTIDEISEIGFDKYNQYLSLICISSDDIAEMLDLDNDLIIEPFEFIYENCKYNEDFKMNIISALSLFFREQVSFDVDMSSFFIGMEGVLHQGNYIFFVDILKRMNCIGNSKPRPKPRNEAEREYYKQQKIAKEKYKKYYESETDMSDIISAICCKHTSINILNIGNLTMYQLIDIYKRISLIDEYQINLTALMHGADNKDMELKHWTSKIKD